MTTVHQMVNYRPQMTAVKNLAMRICNNPALLVSPAGGLRRNERSGRPGVLTAERELDFWAI